MQFYLYVYKIHVLLQRGNKKLIHACCMEFPFTSIPTLCIIPSSSIFKKEKVSLLPSTSNRILESLVKKFFFFMLKLEVVLISYSTNPFFKRGVVNSILSLELSIVKRFTYNGSNQNLEMIYAMIQPMINPMFISMENRNCTISRIGIRNKNENVL